ncbi:MAG TPA: hypothetical protein VIT88_04435 [Pyrinomonadaceae bacterium]
MKIFISWSGPRSKAVALKLRDWIPCVIQSADPSVSEHDIDAGARWGQELEVLLEGSRFGVICLTSGNLKAEWLHFEAGAISKTVVDKRTMVCPYLVDLDTSEIPPGPFTQFQAKRADKKGTFEVLRSINKACDSGLALTSEKLKVSFEKWWPELEFFLRDNLPPEDQAPKDRRSSEEVAKETLNIVRDLSRRLSQYPDPSSIVTVKAKPMDWKAIERIVLDAGLSSDDFRQIASDMAVLPYAWSNAQVESFLTEAISKHTSGRAAYRGFSGHAKDLPGLNIDPEK